MAELLGSISTLRTNGLLGVKPLLDGLHVLPPFVLLKTPTPPWVPAYKIAGLFESIATVITWLLLKEVTGGQEFPESVLLGTPPPWVPA